MTSQTRATLYSYFTTGAKPTQAQYANLIDSSLNISETSAQSVASTVNFSQNANVTGSINVAQAIVVASAAGGNKGTGTINATGIYVNGTLITTTSAGGSGTVTAGTANQLAYYPSSTNTVAGTNALPSTITGVTASAGTGGTGICTNAYADTAATNANRLVLLATTTAANSASITFSSLSGASYESFILYINGVVPVTNAVNFDMTISTGSGFLATGYYHQTFRYSPITTGTGGAVNDSSIVLSSDSETMNSSSPSGFEVHLFEVGNSNPTKRCWWRGVGVWSLGNYVALDGNAAILSNSAPIDGIQFSMSSGNISGGVFKLYGVRK